MSIISIYPLCVSPIPLVPPFPPVTTPIPLSSCISLSLWYGLLLHHLTGTSVPDRFTTWYTACYFRWVTIENDPDTWIYFKSWNKILSHEAATHYLPSISRPALTYSNGSKICRNSSRVWGLIQVKVFHADLWSLELYSQSHEYLPPCHHLNLCFTPGSLKIFQQ